MFDRRLVVAALICLGAAGTAGAQCTSGTLPVLYPITTPTGIGAQRMAADSQTSVFAHGVSGSEELFIYRRTETGWALDTAPVITPPGTVQAIAVQGDSIAVLLGAFNVRTYRRNAMFNRWVAQATLPDTFSAPLAYGAGFLAARGRTQTGVAVFALSSIGAPTFEGYITVPPPIGWSDTFGNDIACDGDLLAIGDFGDDEAAPDAGAVYIFRRASGSTQFLQKLVPATPAAGGHFGQSVALHAGRLVVGQVRSGSQQFGISVPGIDFSNGRVYIYEWNGTAFAPAAQFTHPTLPSSTPTAFGDQVAIRGDRVMVGAVQDSSIGPAAGAAFFFDRVNGAWVFKGPIGLPNGSGGWFGSQIALTDDYAFATAPFHANGTLGMAVFDRCAQPPLPGQGPRCLPGITGLFSYLVGFFQADPWADYNRDGSVSVSDIFAYLRDWFAGCP